MERLALSDVKGARGACLREIRGADEQAVDATTTAAAIRLLDSLLVAESDADLTPGRASELTAGERDRLLGSVYRRIYGADVATTVPCAECEAPFDVDFRVDDLLERLDAARAGVEATRHEANEYALRNGVRVRLPTGQDELALLGRGPQEAREALLTRCTLEKEPSTHGDDLLSALEQLESVADVDIDVICPDCGQEQSVRFNLQSYLLTALREERRRLCREVHRLAAAYGWSLGEILGLTRSERRAYVALVESEMAHGEG